MIFNLNMEIDKKILIFFRVLEGTLNFEKKKENDTTPCGPHYHMYVTLQNNHWRKHKY